MKKQEIENTLTEFFKVTPGIRTDGILAWSLNQNEGYIEYNTSSNELRFFFEHGYDEVGNPFFVFEDLDLKILPTSGFHLHAFCSRFRRIGQHINDLAEEQISLLDHAASS